MRLIDADYFKQQIIEVTVTKNLDLDIANALCDLIDSRRTAYDCDKVVAELTEMQREMESREYYPSAAAYLVAEEVVKAGGVNERQIFMQGKENG